MTVTGSKLVIIESPGKVNKIQQILGNRYRVVSSSILGHNKTFYQDLLNKGIINEIPTFTERDYEPIIENLRSAVRNANKIYLAMDDDIFGEDVVNTLVHELNIMTYERIKLHSLERQMILNSFGLL